MQTEKILSQERADELRRDSLDAALLSKPSLRLSNGAVIRKMPILLFFAAHRLPNKTLSAVLSGNVEELSFSPDQVVDVVEILYLLSLEPADAVAKIYEGNFGKDWERKCAAFGAPLDMIEIADAFAWFFRDASAARDAQATAAEKPDAAKSGNA